MGRGLNILCRSVCLVGLVSDNRDCIFYFFPFMFGIYPYTEVTEKQRVAMKEAGINYVYQSDYELIYSCLRRLLGA